MLKAKQSVFLWLSRYKISSALATLQLVRFRTSNTAKKALAHCVESLINYQAKSESIVDTLENLHLLSHHFTLVGLINYFGNLL